MPMIFTILAITYTNPGETYKAFALKPRTWPDRWIQAKIQVVHRNIWREVFFIYFIEKRLIQRYLGFGNLSIIDYFEL